MDQRGRLHQQSRAEEKLRWRQRRQPALRLQELLQGFSRIVYVCAPFAVGMAFAVLVFLALYAILSAALASTSSIMTSPAKSR